MLALSAPTHLVSPDSCLNVEAYLPERAAKRILSWEWVAKRIVPWERALRRKWPWLLAWMLRRLLRRTGQSDKDLSEFITAVSKADLVIANGMGGITDAFPKYAAELLETMSLAKHYGASTAMVGQGMGPLRDQELREQARWVLPRVDFISLREARASGSLLRELGVRDDRVMTTGDDAIELAHAQRPHAVGTGFGINLRLSAMRR
jgi:colanic acid/amylovoran biosynthesis protein